MFLFKSYYTFLIIRIFNFFSSRFDRKINSFVIDNFANFQYKYLLQNIITLLC